MCNNSASFLNLTEGDKIILYKVPEHLNLDSNRQKDNVVISLRIPGVRGWESHRIVYLTILLQDFQEGMGFRLNCHPI
jgi:hypothetical protein